MKKNLFLIPTLCVLCCACQQATPPSEPEQQNKSEESLEDWELTANVKTAIITDKSLSASARLVSVNSNKGIVTISGTVPTKEDMDRISMIVKKIPGVKKVINQITVSSDQQ